MGIAEKQDELELRFAYNALLRNVFLVLGAFTKCFKVISSVPDLKQNQSMYAHLIEWHQKSCSKSSRK